MHYKHFLYYGNDQCSGTQLKGKYFLYLPNSYYWDVTIDESRLNMLPRVPSPVQLPTNDWCMKSFNKHYNFQQHSM